MRRHALTALAAATTITLGGLTGCKTENRPAAENRPTPGRELGDAQQARLDYSEQLVIRRCMAERGFPYWVPPKPPTAEESKNVGYVLDDVEWAREHGYGGDLARKADAAREKDPNTEYAGGLSSARRAAYDTALGGASAERLTVELPTGETVTSETGGCEAEARRWLYGDLATWFRVDAIGTNLLPLYVPDLLADKRFGKALKAWSRCMHGKGLRYAAPDGIDAGLPRLTQGLSPARAHSTEVRLAVAEATCARSSGLATTGRSLEREYRARVGEPYARDLATRGRLQRAALDRAEELLAGPTG